MLPSEPGEDRSISSNHSETTVDAMELTQNLESGLNLTTGSMGSIAASSFLTGEGRDETSWRGVEASVGSCWMAMSSVLIAGVVGTEQKGNGERLGAGARRGMLSWTLGP